MLTFTGIRNESFILVGSRGMTHLDKGRDKFNLTVFGCAADTRLMSYKPESFAMLFLNGSLLHSWYFLHYRDKFSTYRGYAQYTMNTDCGEAERPQARSMRPAWRRS